jgi:hypothetical protein
LNITNPFGKCISSCDFFFFDVGECGVKFCLEVDKEVEDLFSDAVSVGS